MSRKLEPITRDICGQYKGWNAHQRNGENQCTPCRRAAADYKRSHRHSTGFSKSTLYTESEIEEIKHAAINDATRQFAADHLKKRASRRRK